MSNNTNPSLANYFKSSSDLDNKLRDVPGITFFDIIGESSSQSIPNN
jgi:hypothetical protein